MITLELVQGTPEWNTARAKHFTASEAPIMMGASKKATRNDLLRMKATGDEREYSRWIEEVLFANGHAIEEKARPFAEAIIGNELYPATATDDDGELLASFDGVTMLEDVIWECKQWNAEKADMVRHDIVPKEDYWQVVQQLIVSGAEKALYTVSDGTEEGSVHTWVTLNPEDAKALRAGWKQFAEDLENYQPAETVVEVVGKAPEDLPALLIEVRGEVARSNLGSFKDHALTVIRGINRDLQTDEDFANAEKAVKWCGTVEERLDAAKQHALAQTQSIDELFRAIDDIKAEARRTRLDLEKLVKARKEAVRGEILTAGNATYAEHIDKLNEGLGKPLLSPGSTVPRPDFAGVMKGKKTVKSLRDAVDGELARVKIAASETAELVRGNLTKIEEALGDAPRHLIHDWRDLVFKDTEAVEAIVKNRVAEHAAAEAQRLEAERERIRQEEADKLQREQAEKEAEEAPKPAAEAAPPQSAAKPASAANEPPAPPCGDGPSTLHDELEAWRKRSGVSQDAYDALLAILARHNIRGAA